MPAIRLFTIALIASVFAGCASYGPRAQPFNSEGKSVAYWVDLSDQLQLQWVGATIFNNASAVQTAPEWKERREHPLFVKPSRSPKPTA